MSERLEALVHEVVKEMVEERQRRIEDLVNHANSLGWPALRLYLLAAVHGIDVLNRDFEKDGKEELLQLMQEIGKW